MNGVSTSWPPAPTVTVAPVEQREIIEWDEFTGRTVPVETVEVRPRVSGYVQEVRFRSGQLVRKGDTLRKIANRAGVSLAELCDWNDMPRTARPKKGTVLVVPGKRGPPREVLASTSPAPQGEIRGVPTPAAAVTSASGVGPYTSVPLTTVSRQKEPAPATLAIPAEGFVDTPSRAASSRDGWPTSRPDGRARSPLR